MHITNFSTDFDQNYIESNTIRNKVINYIKNDSCIGRDIKKGEFWEEWMFKYIKKYYKNGTNMIDIGANIGTTTLLMSEVLSEDNKIYSFEPLFYDVTYKNMIDNNLTDRVFIYPFAVSNSDSFLTINKINYNQIRNYGATSLEYCGKNNNTIIKIKTIDSFNFENISLIKIDVENMEIGVLEGCFETINRNKPTILIETHRYRQFMASDIYKKLLGIGYSMSVISEGYDDFILTVE